MTCVVSVEQLDLSSVASSAVNSQPPIWGGEIAFRWSIVMSCRIPTDTRRGGGSVKEG